MMNWIISSSVLILIIITIRHFLKGKMSLCLQYGLWLIVAVRLLIPFSIGEAVTSVSTWLDLVRDRQAVQEIVDFTQAPMQSMTYEDAYESVANDYREIGINIENLPEHVLNGTIENEVQDKMYSGYSPVEIASFLWKFGMVIVGVWFLYSNIQFSMKLRKDRCVYDKIGSVEVYRTNLVDTPCLYGLFTPAIYITDEVMEDEKRLHHVLEHEMTHYRHGDYIWALLRVVCLAIHWYNPLVWCAALLSRRDAELACDEATMKRLGEEERAAYGRTLIGLTCEKRPAVLITATTMTGSKRSIKERIKLIAQKPKMAVITLVVVVVLIITAIGWTFAGAKPPYESFSEWADTLDSDGFESFFVAKGYGEDEIRYQATKEDFEEFLELLKAVPEEKCYRRDQFAEEYEDYGMCFLLADSEFVMHCLEDKTLRCIWASYMPEFAPQGRELIIDSPEIWNYIVDTVNEKGTIGGQEIESEQNTEEVQNTENSEAIEKNEDIVVENGYVQYVLNEMTADLNHDGTEDLVQTVLQIKEIRYDEVKYRTTYWKVQNTDAVVKVYLGTGKNGEYENAPVYVSKAVHDFSMEGRGAYVLTEKAGKDYLLYSNFQDVYEWAKYFYEVIDINENNELRIVENMDAQFVRDIFSKDWENGARREDVIPSLKEDMMPWIQNGKVLITHDWYMDPMYSYGGEEISANTYYDKVWNRRNESENEKELEAKFGTEKWKQYIGRYDWEGKRLAFIENNLIPNVGEYYKVYDGSKLQRLDKYVHKGPNVSYSGSIPTNDEIVYYRVSAGEDEQDAIYKMMECMIKARMIPDENRTCTYTAYAIPEQEMIPITEHMWLVPFLYGYYAFEGTDLVTMQEIIDSGEPVTEDGLVSFVAQGSEEQYFHILIEKDGVYRLERLDNMLSAQ